MSRGYPVWRLLHRKQKTQEVTPLSKAVRRWGAACLSLFVAWIALVGTLDARELALGAGAAAAGTLVVRLVLRTGLPEPAMQRRAWSWAATGLARIPRDLWLLSRGLRSGGRIATVDLPAGVDWRHRAERGVAQLFGTLAPNTIVIDVTADGHATTHALVEDGRR
jgi:multisubunit Na+/H+ antiporter MnhE subunit